MFKVKITKTAEDDIKEAAEWWSENRSSAQAILWYRNVQGAIGSLSNDPELYPIANESVEYDVDLHQLLFGTGRAATHRILYDIKDKDVRIWRVIHTSRDASSLILFEGE